MKRLSALLSVFILLMFCLCSCKGEDEVQPQSQPSKDFVTPYTTQIDGKEYSAVKLDSGTDKYSVGVSDENGNSVRMEYYSGGSLAYYYVSELDENGNEIMQKYYNAEDELLASYDGNSFFDAKGNPIDEQRMNELLGGLG